MLVAYGMAGTRVNGFIRHGLHKDSRRYVEL